MTETEFSAITTRIPARLDRLPWARWHWMADVAAGAARRSQRRRIELAVTPQAAYRHWSPMFPPYSIPLVDTARGREVEAIVAALAGEGPLERPQLARLVHAGQWGPGRFPPALRQAVAQGKVHRTSRGLYTLADIGQDPGDNSTASHQR
jgi:hypothetical protein